VIAYDRAPTGPTRPSLSLPQGSPHLLPCPPKRRLRALPRSFDARHDQDRNKIIIAMDNETEGRKDGQNCWCVLGYRFRRLCRAGSFIGENRPCCWFRRSRNGCEVRRRGDNVLRARPTSQEWDRKAGRTSTRQGAGSNSPSRPSLPSRPPPLLPQQRGPHSH